MNNSDRIDRYLNINNPNLIPVKYFCLNALVNQFSLASFGNIIDIPIDK